MFSENLDVAATLDTTLRTHVWFTGLEMGVPLMGIASTHCWQNHVAHLVPEIHQRLVFTCITMEKSG